MTLMPTKMVMNCFVMNCWRTDLNTLTFEVVHEDEEMLQWTGVCRLCGREFNLVYEKGEQDERNDSRERQLKPVC